MYAEERLKAEIIQEAMQKSGEALLPTRDGVPGSTKRGVSMRLACQTFCINQICYRYQPSLSPKNVLIAIG